MPYGYPSMGVGVTPRVATNPRTGRPSPPTGAGGGVNLGSLLQDPTVAQTLLRFGGSLMQPTPPGQTHLGQAGAGLQDAMNYFVALQDRERRQGALKQQGLLKQQEIQQRADLQAKRIDAESKQAAADREQRAAATQATVDVQRQRNELMAAQQQAETTARVVTARVQAQKELMELHQKGEKLRAEQWGKAVETSQAQADMEGREWSLVDAYRMYNAWEGQEGFKKYADMSQEEMEQVAQEIATGARSRGEFIQGSAGVVRPDDIELVDMRVQELQQEGRRKTEAAAERGRLTSTLRPRVSPISEVMPSGEAGGPGRGGAIAAGREVLRRGEAPYQEATTTELWKLLPPRAQEALRRKAERQPGLGIEQDIRAMARRLKVLERR